MNCPPKIVMPLVALILAAASAPVFAENILVETARRINAERRKHKLRPVKYNTKLAVAAQSQAKWMAGEGKMLHLRGKQTSTFAEWKKSNHHPVNRVINGGYLKWEKLFVLTNKGGKQVLVAKPRANEHVGEIIAHGNPKSGPGRFRPRVIVTGWMNSPGHRKTILTAGFQEIGAGFARTKRGDAFWCVVFGKR
jgi:uncharacterized protein YkwD